MKAHKAAQDIGGRYDCLSGLQTFVSWTSAQREYCCKAYGLGCIGQAHKLVRVSKGQMFVEGVADEFAESLATMAGQSGGTSGWTYTAYVHSGGPLPPWLTFDPVKLQLVGHPPENGDFDVDVDVRATRGGTNPSTLVTSYMIREKPPLVTELTAVTGQPMQFVLPRASFAPGMADAKLTVVEAPGSTWPAWLAFDTTSGSLTGTPSEAEDYWLEVTAKSGEEEKKNMLKLQVADSGRFGTGQVRLPSRLMHPEQQQEDALIAEVCAREGVMCEPVDMNQTPSKAIHYTDTAAECQLECRNLPSCGCFSYYVDLKLCHFSSTMATLVEGRAGWQGGYATCDNAFTGAQSETIFETLMRRSCLAKNVSFFPKASRPDVWPASIEGSVQSCHKRCFHSEGCASFVYNTLTLSCDLQDDSAMVAVAPAYEMAGPRVCDMWIDLRVQIDQPSLAARQDTAAVGSALVKALPLQALRNRPAKNF